MMKSEKRFSLILIMMLAFAILASSCQYLGFGDKNNGLAVPSMVENPEDLELTIDEKGLNEIDRQYLAYGEEKWGQFVKAFDAFGKAMDSYLDKVFNDAIFVTENKDYIQSRDDLMKAIRNIERVKVEEIPQGFKNVYGKLYQVTNRARYLISITEQKNATNLPNDFDAIKAEIHPFKEDIEAFFATVKADGLEAAVAAVPAIDWTVEEARETDLRNTMNVYDYGLKWGASQWDVMGVEGLLEGGYKAENLSYATKVYQYDAVRTYHFNEYGQLDSYSYIIDGASFNRGNFQDPLYDDIYELSSIVMYYFVLDSPALPTTPQDDGTGNYVIVFDQKSEIAELRGNIATGQITLTVTGKTVD